MEKEFTEWFNENENRFSHGQFDEKQIAYSAWLEGKRQSLKQSDVSGYLPDFREVIEARIKHFNSNHHTCEGLELQQALSTIRRLVPPIMFRIGIGGEEKAKLIDIETATKEELIQEYEKCEKEWGKWSCESFGYYIKAIHEKIVELGGFA